MLASAIPSKIQLDFAHSGTKNTIPVASQIGITAGAASYTDGFPPLTMTPLAAGGVPPDGGDMNGILNAITAVQQWQSAGGIFKFDSAFSTAIGGYPAGCILLSTDGSTRWLNLVDNNTTDPDGGSAGGTWLSLNTSNGVTAITGLTNANVTLSSTQYKNPIITLSGTLTGNVQIIFPTTMQRWLVINNTTGTFTVTCKTAAGTGAAVPQSGMMSLYGDGTNTNAIHEGDTRYVFSGADGSAANKVFLTASTTLSMAAHSGKFLDCWSIAASAVISTPTSGYSGFNCIIGPVGTTGVTLYNATANAIYLPDGATIAAGASTTLTQEAGYSWELREFAGSLYLIPRYVMSANNDPTFANSSGRAASTSWVKGWVPAAMSAIATAAGFVFSAAGTGYIKLPSWLGGWIVQWGSVTASSVGDVTATFPIAFPNAVLQIALAPVGTTTSAWASYNTLTNSAVNIAAWSAANTRATTTVSYIAVGH